MGVAVGDALTSIDSSQARGHSKHVSTSLKKYFFFLFLNFLLIRTILYIALQTWRAKFYFMVYIVIPKTKFYKHKIGSFLLL